MTGIPRTEDLLAETRWLRRLARGLVADEALADDVAQDALVASLRAPDGAVRERRAWLSAVARNLVRRRARRDATRTAVEAAVARRESDAVEPSDEVERVRVQRAAVDAVLALDEPYRTTLIRHYLDELPVAAIASRSRVPVETVRTRIKRALAQVRARLDKDHGGRAAWAGPLLGVAAEVTKTTGVMVMAATWRGAAAAAIVLAGAAIWWFGGADGASAPRPAGAEGARGVGAPARAAQEEGGTPTRTSIAAAASAPAASRFVRGVVVDEESGAPLSHMRATWRDDDARVSEVATTDADGAFALPLDGAKAIVLRVSGAGHAAWMDTIDVPGEGGDVDAGTLRLPPGTGLRGHVVDARGLPVERADLVAIAGEIWIDGENTFDLRHAAAVGVTEAGGVFHLAERSVGMTALVALSPRGMGWAELDAARARNETECEVRLEPAGSLVVRVVGEDGKAIPGAVVELEPRRRPLGTSTARGLRGRHVAELRAFCTRRADAEGNARWDALPASDRMRTYSVLVKADGHRAWRSAPIDLRTGTENDVDVRLAALTHCAFAGRVVDRTGRAIARARVAVDFGGDGTAVTGPDGTFRVEGLCGDEDQARVRVSAEGFAVAGKNIDVAPGAESVACDLVLETAVVLEGRVVDRAGAPIAGARVSSDGRADVVCDERGRFRLDGLVHSPAHDVWLSVPGGGFSYHRIVAEGAPIELVADAAAGASLRVALTDEHGLPVEPSRAWLYFDPDGTCEFQASELRIGAITAGELRVGMHELRIQSKRGPDVWRRFEVRAPGEVVELALTVGAGRAFEGEVVVEGGEPPAGFDLSFEGPGGHWVSGEGAVVNERVRSLELDLARSRRFSVVGAPLDAPVTIGVGDGAWVGSVTVPPGERGPVRLVVRRAATVVFATTEPWPWAELELTLRAPGEEWERGSKVLLMGERFQLEQPLAAGTYEWRIVADGRQLTGRVTAVSGERTRVEVRASAAR